MKKYLTAPHRRKGLLDLYEEGFSIELSNVLKSMSHHWDCAFRGKDTAPIGKLKDLNVPFTPKNKIREGYYDDGIPTISKEEWLASPEARWTNFIDRLEVCHNPPEMGEELIKELEKSTWYFNSWKEFKWATNAESIRSAILSLNAAYSTNPDYLGTLEEFREKNGGVPAVCTLIVNAPSPKQLHKLHREKTDFWSFIYL